MSYDTYKQWKKERDAQVMQTNGQMIVNKLNQKVADWYKSYESFMNDYQSRYAQRKGTYEDAYVSDSADWYEASKKRRNQLAAEAYAIQAAIEPYKDYLDKDWLDGISNMLETGKQHQASLLSVAESDRDWWAIFEDEDHYKAYAEYKFRSSADNAAGRQQRYEDNQKKIAELENAIKEYRNWYYDAKDKSDYSFHREWVSKYGSVSDAEKEIERLKAENQQYEYGEGEFVAKSEDEYSKLDTNTDFNLGAANRNFGNPSVQAYDEAVLGLYGGRVYDENGNIVFRSGSDPTADASSEPQVYDKLGFWKSYMASSSTGRAAPSYGYTASEILQEAEDCAWGEMTVQDERRYYYLLNTQGQEAAYKYLDDMAIVFTKRRMQNEIQQTQEEYRAANFWGKAWMNIKSVPANVLGGGIAFIDDAVRLARDGEINPYSNAHSWRNYAGTVRNETVLDIDGKDNPNWLTWGDAYQAGMSTLDMAFGSMFGGGYGVLMGMGAASDEATRLYQQGATMEQAVTGGILSGAAEMICENLSLGNLKAIKNMGSPKGFAQWAKTVLVQGGVEASEEALTEIANTVTNAIVMGTQSDWAKLEEELGTPGALLSKTLDVLHSGLMGFMSGSVSGGAVSGISAINAQNQFKALGKDINDAVGGVDALKQLANEVAGVSPKNMQKTLEKQVKAVDKKATNRRVGRLLDTVNTAYTAQNQADIATKLEQQGFDSKKAKDIAEALVAKHNNQTLTKEQEKLLESVGGKQEVHDVLAATINNKESAMSQRSQKLHDFQNEVSVGRIAKAYGVSKEEAKKIQNLTASIRTEIEHAENFENPETYEVSAEGKSIDKAGNDVNIVGVDSYKDGKMYLKTASGETIESGEVLYGSRSDALIYEAVARLDASPEAAWAIIKGWDQSSGVSAREYAADIKLAYTYGKLNYQAGLKNVNSKAATAFQMGREDTAKSAKKTEQASTDSTLSEKNADKQVIFEGFTYDEKTASKLQRASMDAVELVNKMSSLEIHVYKSYKRNGKFYAMVNGKERLAPNGYFTEGNKIYIDLNAGNKGEGFMLYTLSHEIGHYIAQWNAQDFQAISDFLFAHYGKDMPVAALLEEQKRKLKNSYRIDGKAIPGEAQLEKEAHEELVCDMLSRMLADKHAYDKLAELKQTDLKLHQKLGLAIKKALDKLAKAIGVYKTQNPDAWYAASKDNIGAEAFRQLQDLYMKAFVQADANHKAAEGQKNTTENGGVKYSFGVEQSDIDAYVEAAYVKGNTSDYKKYAKVNPRLQADVADEIDISEYAHALRDNDIRHIRNSHGEASQEKYPVTMQDIKNIPWLVENYDKVYVVRKSNNRTGIMYVKVNSEGIVYYLEQVTTVYGNEPLLINKQMVKTGIGDILDIPELRDAITKKQSEAEFLNDLKKAQQVYAQSVNQLHSNTKITQPEADVKTESAEAMDISLDNENSDTKNSGRDIVKYADRGKIKTFKNGQNAKGEFIANVLIDLDDSYSEWWTGRYNRGILGMSQADDTEFQQFYEEILKRTKDMDEYGETEQPTVEDVFVVQDGRGREYVYRVVLDGRLHGVVLGKADLAKYERAMQRYERSKPHGRSNADISGRATNARLKLERNTSRDSGASEPLGNSGHGRLGSRSPQSDNAGYVRKGESADQTVPDVTDGNGQTRNSDRDYSYEALTRKPDMVVTTVGGNVPSNRADVVALAKKNAAKVGKFDPKTGSVSVHVDDIDTDVILGSKGLEHGLRRLSTSQTDPTWLVTLNAGEILKNAIKINEITPSKKEASSAYVLIGVAHSKAGDQYVVRYVVNQFSHELTSMDVLYTINAKKEDRLRSMRPGFQGPVTDPKISIADLLDLVNQHFPDILPEGVLKHYGYDARPEGDLGEDALYQERSDGSGFSDAEYDGVALNDIRNVLKKGVGISWNNGNSIKLGKEEYAAVTSRISTGYWAQNSHNGVQYVERSTDGNNAKFYLYLFVDHGFGDYEIIARLDYSKQDELIDELRRMIQNGRKTEGVFAGTGRLRTFYGNSTGSRNSNSNRGSEIVDGEENSGSRGQRRKDSGRTGSANLGGFNEKSNIVKPEDYVTKTIDRSGKSESVYQERSTNSVSNRSLLANALESATQNEIEKSKIQEYKSKIDLINAEEEKLDKLNAQIKELSFAKGPRDQAKIRALRDEATKTANRITTYDKQLLRLEASKPLQDVLRRERKKAYKRAEQKGREALDAYRENALKKQEEILERWQKSREKGIDSRNRTALRHKIQKVVRELNHYLLNGTKERHVPIELQKAVAEALDVVNMDTVGAEERIAKLKDELLKAKTPEQIQEISRKIDHVQQMGERMDERLKKLRDAYDQFVNADDPLIANSYDEVISEKLESVIESVGDTPLRDMTKAQLEDVYDMYRMVLTTIRNANKAFKAKKSESISAIANKVMLEVKQVGGQKKVGAKALEGIKEFGWNNLKPVYAFEHIGSDAFKEVFNNVRAGEDVWAVDITEARQYYLNKSKSYNYGSWNFKQRHKFTSTSGMDFELTLEQIMSLYAYSKRDQAAEHLRKGGIVIDESTEITVKNKLGIPVKFNPTEATAYNISEETLAEIVGKLTAEQKSFVDEMQEYLSTVMGEKGNEVSLELYGIKLFKEKFYFPLKSATQFMAKAKEQQQGEVKIKNKGFSKETVQKASNPIVLTPFMNVWADHVNEMSMYHAFTLPMEDFYRVYNYKTPTSDTAATESVEMFIQNAYGKGATKYIDQLLKDLNGGARTDSTTGFINKMIGLFKKGSVFASLSVTIQQPSAIARAAALVDTNYFIGPKVDSKRHKALWDEVKRYAPVAIIKEMGYFDTNMGKSTQDFILGREYSGIKEKMKALVTDSNFRDEALSKAPALADELAWCSIWEAVKRETKDKHPGMDVKSEAFLNMAGERFTDVIVKTQVYDSVLARSGNMRSKDTGMKMATAFMAEPTTSINMIADALLQGKRGNKQYCRKAIGAVIASQIINSILVSFVYAGRDDDEDETYLEKYTGALTGEILDSMNPLTYIPFIKDIVSIVKGYDVERSDMSVISDLVTAWQKLDNKNVSVYRKVEGFVGSIAQFFGLPVKNIMRDVRGIYQTIMSFASGQQTTWAGVGYSVVGAVTGKDVPDHLQLYNAYLGDDKAHLARVVGRYEDPKEVNSAMRKAIKEHFVNGDIDSEMAISYLVKYAGTDEDDAFWKVKEWEYENEHDDEFGKYNDFYGAVQTGKNIKTVIKEYTGNGVSKETLASQITTYFKPLYKQMSNYERASIKGYLLNAYELLGYDRTKKSKDIDKWLED